MNLPTYKVTHVDARGRRRQQLFTVHRRETAETLAQLMFGTPRYLAAVRQREVRP